MGRAIPILVVVATSLASGCTADDPFPNGETSVACAAARVASATAAGVSAKVLRGEPPDPAELAAMGQIAEAAGDEGLKSNVEGVRVAAADVRAAMRYRDSPGTSLALADMLDACASALRRVDNS